jgi:hypothetical protein
MTLAIVAMTINPTIVKNHGQGSGRPRFGAFAPVAFTVL